jgi:hypothetical protein
MNTLLPSFDAQLQAVARSLDLVDGIGKNGYKADPVSAFVCCLIQSGLRQ